MIKRRVTGRQRLVMMLAHAVRNAVEDFHAANTPQTIKNTNEYMPEFNAAVRNAIYTTLHIFDAAEEGSAFDQELLAWAHITIPDYWEVPKLKPSYKRAKRKYNQQQQMQGNYSTEEYTT